ncbi:MAG: DUF3429 domain-containing protein [Reyranella sp.]|nr:DUF3429 domain-containing protein [Reyranella sp.]
MPSARRKDGVNKSPTDPSNSAGFPATAIWLGALGLLPFGGTALSAAFLDSGYGVWAMTALMAYGAVILSFLGGIHWGLAIASDPRNGALPRRLIVSVAPSLVAWAGLLLPLRVGLLVLAAGFAATLYVDLRATRAGEAPSWYPRLRRPLSIAVLAALSFSYFAWPMGVRR